MFASLTAEKSSSQKKATEQERRSKSASRSGSSVRQFEPGTIMSSGAPVHSLSFRAIPRFSPEEEMEYISRAPQYAPLSLPIQPMLEIGAVDDPLEGEADRVARHVMRMPDSQGITSTPSAGSSASMVQRACSCGGTCELCRKSHSSEHVEAQRKVDDLGISAATSATSSRQEVPSVVDSVLRSSGEPLPPSALSFFEPRFAFDFSRIRIHADDRAAASASAIRARAYTAGQHIVFGRDQYQPDTSEGRHLLAHELTHTIQQMSGPGRVGRANSVPGTASAQSHIMRAPATPHPAVMRDIEAKFTELYSKLSLNARFQLNRYVTIAIAVVTEKGDTQANSPRYVVTLSSNASSREIDAAIDEMGMTRWKPGSRAAGRGDVGAPNDAEQLLTEGASENNFDVWAAGINRRTCADCTIHMHEEDVQVRAFPDPDFRSGGKYANYVPPRKTQPSPPANAPGEDAPPADPKSTAPPTKTTGGQRASGGGPEGNEPTPTSTAPKVQQPVKTGGGSAPQVGEQEGGGTPTTVPRTTGPAVRGGGGGSQLGIQIGTGIASVGIGWLAGYLKARVDQKIADRQIEAFLHLAKEKINANPDEALKKMMIMPEGNVYAWVHLTSSVITFFEVGMGAEPESSSSSPMIDFARVPITYSFGPVDQSMVESFPSISGGGRHITVTREIIIDIPLQMPSVENLLAAGKARNLPLDRLRDYVMYRLQRVLAEFQYQIDMSNIYGSKLDNKASIDKAQKETAYWQNLLDQIMQSEPHP